MKIRLAKRFRCAECATDALEARPLEMSTPDRMRSGVLVCRDCSAWYPVEGHVADLLPEAHAEPGSRRGFYERHRPGLEEFRLRPPRTDCLDPSFAAQAHQREHFDDLASRGDRFSYDALGRMAFQRAIRSLNFEEWAPLIRPGSLVLDVGCADGLSTFDIARDGIEVIGLDVSHEQIRRAQARAEREGVENVSFVIGDADSLPLADRTLDSVLCYGSLHHVPHPERTIAEMARTLRSGGSYLGVENNTTPLRPIFDALMRLRPIWLEEAGTEAQISSEDLDRWTEGTGLRVETRPIVFVPPQLCNLLGYRASRLTLRVTDWLCRRIPGVRNWGGLIFVSGEKLEPAASSNRLQPARAG